MCAVACASTQAASVLRCRLEAPARAAAGAAVPLRFTVTNAGNAGVQLLRWNTPLEGEWFAPFVEVLFDGRALPYRGPAMKRGDPSAADYLWLGSGASESAQLDLGRAFDLTKAGRYQVVPHIRLLDVFDAARAQAPRQRKAHTAAELDCPSVDLAID
jgi:peptidyl-Lys metalloendopeptidase